MDGLQAKLDPNGLLRIERLQQGENFIRQTVRPCGDRQRDDLRMADGCAEKTFHARDAAVCVCEILKIGDVLPGPVFGCDAPPGLLDLLRDIGSAVGSEFSGTGAAAKDAAAGVQRAVPVRAGEAAVKREFIDFGAEAFLQFLVQCVVIHMDSVSKGPAAPTPCFTPSSAACGPD